MRRRSSGSAAEEEGDDSGSNEEVNAAAEGAGGHSKFDDSKLSQDSRNIQTTSRHSNTRHTSFELDRRKSIEKRPAAARSRIPSNTNWKPAESRNGTLDKNRSDEPAVISVPSKEAIADDKMVDSRQSVRRSRLRSPWSCSLLTLVTTLIATLSLAAIIHSFVSRQLDTKGCRMSYMRPSFAKLSDFDTEHTRFASKYSVYLYREGMVDEDTKVRRQKCLRFGNTD
jgi:glycosylphosphatidylinositol deacylase